MRRVLLGCVLLALLAGCQASPSQQRFVVFFSAWQSDLDAPARKVVADVAALAANRPHATLTIDGYASTAGGGSVALRLSAKRAQTVQDALVAAGVPPTRIIRHANGEVDYSFDTEESRRVVITLGER